MRQTLYRFYDLDEQLLYIGISDDLGRRLDQHVRGKTWWQDVAVVRVEHHPDRASVRAAERHAIQTEHPLHNVVHAVPRTVPACSRCADDQRATLTERERQQVQQALSEPRRAGQVLSGPDRPHTCEVTAVTEVRVTASSLTARNSDRSDRRGTARNQPLSLTRTPADLQRQDRSDHQ